MAITSNAVSVLCRWRKRSFSVDMSDYVPIKILAAWRLTKFNDNKTGTSVLLSTEPVNFVRLAANGAIRAEASMFATAMLHSVELMFKEDSSNHAQK